MAIETKTVQRRRLHFTKLSDITAEAERLAAAEKSGKLKTLGNWTCGQVFNHLANWASYPYEGFPQTLKRPPWFIRPLLKSLKPKYLAKGMPQGSAFPESKAAPSASNPWTPAPRLRNSEPLWHAWTQPHPITPAPPSAT